MFKYKEFATEPDKLFVKEAQMDEVRGCATFSIVYRFGIHEELAIWKCFELERREIIEVEDDFDVALNGLYKNHETEFLVHKTNLEKVAGYANTSIGITP